MEIYILCRVTLSEFLLTGGVPATLVPFDSPGVLAVDSEGGQILIGERENLGGIRRVGVDGVISTRLYPFPKTAKIAHQPANSRVLLSLVIRATCKTSHVDATYIMSGHRRNGLRLQRNLRSPDVIGHFRVDVETA